MAAASLRTDRRQERADDPRRSGRRRRRGLRRWWWGRRRRGAGCGHGRRGRRRYRRRPWCRRGRRWRRGGRGRSRGRRRRPRPGDPAGPSEPVPAAPTRSRGASSGRLDPGSRRAGGAGLGVRTGVERRSCRSVRCATGRCLIRGLDGRPRPEHDLMRRRQPGRRRHRSAEDGPEDDCDQRSGHEGNERTCECAVSQCVFSLSSVPPATPSRTRRERRHLQRCPSEVARHDGTKGRP